MVFPSSVPIGYPVHMEHNSSGVWFGYSNASGWTNKKLFWTWLSRKLLRTSKAGSHQDNL